MPQLLMLHLPIMMFLRTELTGFHWCFSFSLLYVVYQLSGLLIHMDLGLG